MSVARTSLPSSTRACRPARSASASRVHRPTSGGSGSWAWRPHSRSARRTGVRAWRSSRPWRARVARLSARRSMARTVRIRRMTELAEAYETVNVHRRAGAAIIELNRPDSMNAWNYQFGVDLKAAVELVAGDDTVRAVCVTGAGRGFSSGADLKDMGQRDTTPEGHPDVYTTLTERYHPIITGLRTMPKPVVAAVNGPAVGSGLSLALGADLVVAKRSAYF